MNAQILGNYLYNQAKDDPKLQQLYDKAAQLIEEHGRLSVAVESSQEFKCRLTMDLYTLQTAALQRQIDCLEQREALTEIRQAHKSHLEFHSLLNRIDFKKNMICQLQQEQSKKEEDLLETKAYFDRRIDRLKKMEARHIVQRLREHQRKYITLQNQDVKVSKEIEDNINDANLSLQATRVEVNKKILDLVIMAKKLEVLQEEVKSNDMEIALSEIAQDEMPETFAQLLNEPDKIDCNELPKMPTLDSLFSNVQSNQTKALSPQESSLTDENENNLLRSVLRNEKTIAEEIFIWPSNSKHVHFQICSIMESDNSNSCSQESDTNLTATAVSTAETAVTISSPLSTTPQSINSTENVDKQIEVHSAYEDEIPQITELEIEDIPSPEYEKCENHVTMPNKQTNANVNLETENKTENEKHKIIIQDCQVISPAGTPLPIQLPIVLSPIQVNDSKENKAADEQFKTPPRGVQTKQNPEQTQNSSFNNFLQQNDEDIPGFGTSEESEQIAASKQNPAKKNSFEQFLSMNAENGEDIETTEPFFQTPEFFNFNSAEMQMDIDSTDGFAIDFSDADRGDSRKTNNFL